MNQKSKLCAKSYLSLVEEIRSHENITIKDFEIGFTLGNGTFGKVKQVRYKHIQSDFVFALKILKKTDLVKLNQVSIWKYLKTQN
jgi:protein kinase A/protein kinase X